MSDIIYNMAEKIVTAYLVSSGVTTIITDEAHGLPSNTYISIRNVAPQINGQYFIQSVTSDVSFTIDTPDVPDTETTYVDGRILYTSFNNSGKPAYIYDESAETWYQISGRVNTNGNYSWTGTHLFQAPVTMEDILTLSNISASVSSSPVGGGYIYVEDGELKFKGGNGTITTIAPA